MKSALVLIIAASLASSLAAFGAEAPQLYTIPLQDIDGKPTSLKEYSGKVLLIVNVASKCGFTKQYTGLEALWRKYKDKGVVVLGFPCNDFGSQEPGTNAEIKGFCSSEFEVSFPLFDKLHVKGPDQHPLYAALTGADLPVPGPVKWNFAKFLVSSEGKILKRFDSAVTPEAPELLAAIDAAIK